jgi:putative ABC transport system permease protein
LNPIRHKPPKLAQKALLGFLREDISEEVQGDLEEKFYLNLKKQSPFRSKLSYWFQVLNYMRPFAIKKFRSGYSNYLTMYQHNIKISWRSLTKQKIFSVIKIGGLATGIAACLLIVLFVQYSLSYDKHYHDGDLLYRVIGVYDERGSQRSAYYPAGLVSSLKSEFPEIEVAGRFIGNELLGGGRGNRMIRRPDEVKSIYEEGFIFMDQGLLDILKPTFVYGNPSQVLTEPNSLAISKSKAEKFFPNENPVGKSLILNNEKQPFVIKGVFEDFPAASFFQYDFLQTIAGTEFWTGEDNEWKNKNIHQTFIRVLPGTNTTLLASKVTEEIVKNHMLSNWRDIGLEEIAKNFRFELQPVKDIYLRSAGMRDGLNHGDVRFIWILGAVAGFILIIACINFINLSTARSANRATEIGLRKVVGSFRKELVSQFLVESVVFSTLAFFLALIISIVFLPYFNNLTKMTLILPWNEWWFLPLFIAASVITGICAGLYPAVYLSGFKPISMLSGTISQGGRSSGIRSMLVIFQFAVSFVLIIGTFIILRQTNFILNKDLGFSRTQVLQINGTDIMNKQLPAFKRELLKLPNVESASVSDYLPIAGARRNGNVFWKDGRKEIDKPVEAQIWFVDEDYIKTMGMKILEGRDFNFEMASDSQSVIINQTMSKALGLDRPVGQVITSWSSWKVIGVVKDFNFESLTSNVGPLCLIIANSPWVVSVRVNTSEISGVINSITDLWDQFCPNETIRYSFLDESFEAMYSDVKRTGRIIMSFAFLAIIIACLGLFALSSYMIEQRRREISIRLVMGASLISIYKLLTRNFLIMVAISFIVAVPLAWYIMHKWIENYAYRIQITWDMFLLAGLIGILIAILTISYQSIKAAYTNPVDKLR